MSRKLATVRTIREITSIDGADRIEIVKVDGWQSITQKNQFKLGDQAVYFECDSWLPNEPRYAFLKERCYRKNELGEGMRLKTMKLKKQLTQGLLMPLSDYPEIPCNADGRYNEELDYTELLNVKLYEVPVSANLAGQVRGQFPSYITKTDEERIQNEIEYFSLYKDVTFEASEKLDGCLDENTTILTEDGLKTIKEMYEENYKGKVQSYNVDENKIEFQRVLNYLVQENNDDWYEIEVESGDILRLTGEHRVFLPDLGCYRYVRELNGDEVVLINK